MVESGDSGRPDKDVQEARRPILGATLLVLLSAGCFGANSILTLVATRAGVPLFAVLFWRYGLAAPMLAAIAGTAVLSGPGRLAIPRRRLLPLLTLGGGGQALVIFLAMTSLNWIPAATLGFLFYTYPAWVAVFAALRGSESFDRRRVLALGLSLAGIAFMVGAPLWGSSGALHPAGERSTRPGWPWRSARRSFTPSSSRSSAGSRPGSTRQRPRPTWS